MSEVTQCSACHLVNNRIMYCYLLYLFYNNNNNNESFSCYYPTMDTGFFPVVKRPGRGADHLPPSRCRGHETVGLYLYSPSGPQRPVKGRNFMKKILPVFMSMVSLGVPRVPANLMVGVQHWVNFGLPFR